MEVQNYSDTMDDLLAGLTTNQAVTAHGVPAANVLEAAGSTIDMSIPTPFIYIAGTPSEEYSVQGYATVLDVDIIIGAEPQESGANALREAFSYASKVAGFIDASSTIYMELNNQLPVEYIGTFAGKAIIKLNYKQPFILLPDVVEA